MKIAVVMASSGVSEIGLRERQRYLQETASPGTEVVMVPNPEAPAAIVDAYESHLAAVHTTRLVREAQEDGFDAAVIWCGDDPGLEAARQRVTIPVVGPATASLSVARLVGDTFGYISSDGSPAHIWQRARAAGLGDRLKSVACLPIEVLDIRADLDRTFALTESAIADGVAAGAHSFILGCMAMWGMAPELTRRSGVPVIDGGQAAVLTAEMLVRLGIGQSPVAYPASPAAESFVLSV
jgi:allantoin racemase